MIRFFKRYSILTLLLSMAVVPFFFYDFTSSAQGVVLGGWNVTSLEVVSNTHDTNDTQGDRDVIQVRVSWTKPADTRANISVNATGTYNANLTTATSNDLPLADTSGETTITLDTDSTGLGGHSCDGYDLLARINEFPAIPRANRSLTASHDGTPIKCLWTIGVNTQGGTVQGWTATHSGNPDNDSVGISVIGTKGVGDYGRAKIYVNDVLKGTVELGRSSDFDFIEFYQNIVANSTPPHNANGYTVQVKLFQLMGISELERADFTQFIPHP